MSQSVGEALISLLAARGVEVVFGIPGVHTIELYRGLADSDIRHVTARHEQGAGFMADGYSRASDKVGVAFVITGPGLTNILTPMAQARADSIPMLVISSVNKTTDLGRGLGHLHELPDQLATSKTVAKAAFHVAKPTNLEPILDQAFVALKSERPGPVHIEIPMDVLACEYESAPLSKPPVDTFGTNTKVLNEAQTLLSNAQSPVVLVGGGAKECDQELLELAEIIDAPVIQSANARGLMFKHPLCVPASPSLPAVRQLLKDADVVLGIGTELGPTDINMYRDDGFPELNSFIRIDCCPAQLQRHKCKVALLGDAQNILPQLSHGITSSANKNAGADRAASANEAALVNLPDNMKTEIALIEAMRDAFPQSIMVGDSTQLIYAGNLYYSHDRPAGWFNAATGFGALGYAIPAAVGAALAHPGERIICIVGDGGAQFTIAELMTAVDEKLPILFLIWNNNGFGEIETSMVDAVVKPVGCDPTAPDFEHVAAACGMPYRRCQPVPSSLVDALTSVHKFDGPAMIEIILDAPSRPTKRNLS